MKQKRDPYQIVYDFLHKAVFEKGQIIIGIDPGVNGAIGLVCGKLYAVIDIPIIKTKVKKTKKTTKEEYRLTGHKTKTVIGTSKKFDLKAICDIFKLISKYKAYVNIILEEIPIRLGPRNPYADIVIGRAYAMWPLFLASKDFKVIEVRPAIWKEALKLSSKDKETSRKLALKLFPKADIKLKKYHDRAEAMLLAFYGRNLC